MNPWRPGEQKRPSAPGVDLRRGNFGLGRRPSGPADKNAGSALPNLGVPLEKQFRRKPSGDVALNKPIVDAPMRPASDFLDFSPCSDMNDVLTAVRADLRKDPPPPPAKLENPAGMDSNAENSLVQNLKAQLAERDATITSLARSLSTAQAALTESASRAADDGAKIKSLQDILIERDTELSTLKEKMFAIGNAKIRLEKELASTPIASSRVPVQSSAGPVLKNSPSWADNSLGRPATAAETGGMASFGSPLFTLPEAGSDGDDVDESPTLSSDRETGKNSTAMTPRKADLIRQRCKAINSHCKLGEKVVGRSPGYARLQNAPRITLTLYRRGLTFHSTDSSVNPPITGVFREYSWPATQAVLDDLVDGYLPFELQGRFPDGVAVDVSINLDIDSPLGHVAGTVASGAPPAVADFGVGRRLKDGAAMARGPSSAAKQASEQFLQNIPEEIIHNGVLARPRAELAAAMGVAGPSRPPARSEKPSTEVPSSQPADVMTAGQFVPTAPAIPPSAIAGRRSRHNSLSAERVATQATADIVVRFPGSGIGTCKSVSVTLPSSTTIRQLWHHVSVAIVNATGVTVRHAQLAPVGLDTPAGSKIFCARVPGTPADALDSLDSSIESVGLVPRALIQLQWT